MKFANGNFVKIDELHIDLIRSINPFADAFEILSKNFDAPTFRKIKDAIALTKISMTEEEALILYPQVREFVIKNNQNPNIDSFDSHERRLAECILFIQNKYRENGK